MARRTRSDTADPRIADRGSVRAARLHARCAVLWAERGRLVGEGRGTAPVDRALERCEAALPRIYEKLGVR